MATALATPPSIAEYLGPENLAFVSRMAIEPRQRSLGMMTGAHKSPQTGAGIEFALHRPYVRGDDIRRLDWNVYGRNERLYIKKYEETTELRGLICLDASGSMGFCGDPDGKRPAKFEFGCRLAAALAYLLLQQGDAVSLVLFGSKVHQIVPPSSSPVQIARILSALQGAHAEEPASGKDDPPLADVLHELAERFRRREFFILISDLMEQPEALSKFLGHLRHGRHEGLLMHTLDPLELDFPFRGWVRFQSLECGERHLLESGGFRKAYLEALRHYLEDVRKAALLYGMDYLTCRTDRPWREVLFDALVRRRLVAR